VLNDGKKVAILVGAGALHATGEVMETAGKLGAGVAPKRSSAKPHSPTTCCL
jgi:thiamine pyrophosphate-dependent acetolactate synthase large subunit-like protein